MEAILLTTTRVERLVVNGTPEDGVKGQLLSNPSRLENVPPSIVTRMLGTLREYLLKTDITLEEDGEDETIPLKAHSLRHLELIHQTDTIIFFLTDPTTGLPQALTHLSISGYGMVRGPEPLHNRLLAAVAPTLEILEIEFSHPFVLLPLPLLRHLALRIHADRAKIPPATPSSLAVALQATPHLQKLTVAIFERRGAHSFDWGLLARTHDPAWLVLDKRLCEMHAAEPNESSKLVDVHFSLRYIQAEPARYASFVADQLPRALGAEFLTFSGRISSLLQLT
ncbi:hypothetical protein C8R45DRAFT_999227 [Mycena sanguinolenta]|nr:hypothetical protein C8R45DRAFT_999227 [Mycena sanguinolenta]